LGYFEFCARESVKKVVVAEKGVSRSVFKFDDLDL